MDPRLRQFPPEPDSTEMVELGEDSRVPRRFSVQLTSGPDVAGFLDLVVEMVDLEPKVLEVRITPSLDEPLDLQDLANIDWRAAGRAAVQRKALEYSGYVPGEGGPRSHRDVIDRARRVAEASVRRNAVTKSDLARVVALVDEVGVEGAAKETGKSRGYIYKLLRRAQEELQ
jgi:hypothetical protein